jgi:alkylation response protein AidB-like acyl-CoA dehydrogenase
MRFDLSDEHALAKESARDFLEKEASLESMRPVMEESEAGYPEDLYAKLAELGYLGIWLPEDRGGADMGMVGLVAVLHEMGRVAFPGPFLDRVIAIELLRHCRSPAAQKVFQSLTAGETHVVLAHAENAMGGAPQELETRYSDGRLSGTKRFVPFAADTDHLLVTTREGITLAERPGGEWSCDRLVSVDHAQRFCDLRFDQPAELIASSDESRDALASAQRLGSLGAAAWLLGGMERAFEITLDYLKERETFGAPIGSYQALQHRAADMLLKTESSRAVVYRAAWCCDEEPETAKLLVATAKAFAGRAARYVCGEAIQMHGGVGYTWEYDPHIYLKRTKTLEQFYGTVDDQLATVLQERGL